jgi:uncharacterized membrane protein
VSAAEDAPPRAQSALKALSWRVVASIDTFVISYFVTGNLVFAGSIVSVEVVSKMALYYLHERAWAKGWNFWRHRRAAARAASVPTETESAPAEAPFTPELVRRSA